MISKFYEELTKQPGKFEGEARYVPYFYDLMLEGTGEQLDDEVISIKITPEDIKIFPELQDYKEVLLTVDNNGFVYGSAV